MFHFSHTYIQLSCNRFRSVLSITVIEMLNHYKMLVLTFDLQANLVLCLAQEAAGHTGIGSLVLHSGPFDLQGPVDVDAVLTSIQTAALPILKPIRMG